MTTTYRRTLAAVLAALALPLAACGDDPDPRPVPPAPAAQTTAVDGPDADTVRDDTVTLVPAATAAVADAVQAPRSELDDPLREPTDTQKAGILEGPSAAQEFPGCRTRFVQNYSSRRGQQVRIIVWHQTVSRDNPGVADQDALTAYANSPSSGVSWHFLIGRADGLCTFSVPLNMKAWTQGNANPFSIGIEVQAYGDEPRYVEPAGERKLLAVTRELGRRFGIPMRRGKVVNCQPVTSGIVEHSELGACGGGHSDVTPWSTDPLIAKLASGGVTEADRVTCRKLNAWRKAGRPEAGQWRINSIRRRQALDRRGVTCLTSGPVRR